MGYWRKHKDRLERKARGEPVEDLPKAEATPSAPATPAAVVAADKKDREEEEEDEDDDEEEDHAHSVRAKHLCDSVTYPEAPMRLFAIVFYPMRSRVHPTSA